MYRPRCRFAEDGQSVERGENENGMAVVIAVDEEIRKLEQKKRKRQKFHPKA
jgi:endonuclease YncB( thermonuclease family)